MFKYYFERVEGVATYPVLALLIFFVFFLLMLVWLFRTNKNYIQKMKNMPLQDDSVDFKSNINYE